MTEIETLSENAIVIMVGVRDASALRREPTAAHPDGHHTMFTLTDLVTDGLMMGGQVGTPLHCFADLDRTARGLCKRGLMVRRTLYTRVYYGLSEEGLALVGRIEAEAGVTGLVAAEHERNEAAADLAAAEN